MKEPTWSSGPWVTVSKEPAELLLKRRYWQIGRSDGDHKGVALVFGDDDGNAELIAAAPDLYRVLAAALLANDYPEAQIDGAGGYKVPADHWMAEARRVLARARGEKIEAGEPS